MNTYVYPMDLSNEYIYIYNGDKSSDFQPFTFFIPTTGPKRVDVKHF